MSDTVRVQDIFEQQPDGSVTQYRVIGGELQSVTYHAPVFLLPALKPLPEKQKLDT